MDNIILYLLHIIQAQYQQICWLLNFICRYIPLKQWAFDDSHSPKYQKYKIDELPHVCDYKQDWNYKDLISYYERRYNKKIKPIKRHGETDIPDDCHCPHCGHVLEAKKKRKHFIVHKCINPKCPYYLYNLKKVDKKDLNTPNQKYKYKLHYIYREFVVDFFKMDLNSLPNNASSLRFRKHDAHVMSLCLTFHVNLGLSLRKTSQALKDLYDINISHQQVANYARTAALVIKPFVDNYNYNVSSTFTADETYIKVRGIKGYIWFIMDSLSRSIIGYQVSDNRGVGPCIMVMRMAFRHIKELPKDFKFIADGYSAYPLAAQQFFHKYGEAMKFNITKVIGLTNDDAVSTKYRKHKQIVERLNRTFKASYRVSCGYDNYESANYNVALWVAYYNFLRPHEHNHFKVLNEVDMLKGAENMPGKWQLLIFLGQQTILEMQKTKSCDSICS